MAAKKEEKKVSVSSKKTTKKAVKKTITPPKKQGSSKTATKTATTAVKKSPRVRKEPEGLPEQEVDRILDVLQPLTPKQKLFVTYYTSPDSETYGDKSKSFRKAYKKETQGNRRLLQNTGIEAHKESKKPLIANAIDTILDSYDYGFTVRLGGLAAIGKGKYCHTTSTTTTAADGKVTKHVTKSTPKAGDVIKSIDTINKMTGIYSQSAHSGKAESQRIQSIQNRMQAQVRKLRDVTPKQPTQAPEEPLTAPAGESGEGD